MVSASIGGGRLGTGAREVRGSGAASGSQSSVTRTEGPQATPERPSNIFEFRGNALHLRYHGIEMVVAPESPEADKRCHLSTNPKRGEISLTIDQAQQGVEAHGDGASVLRKLANKLPYKYAGVGFSLKEIEPGAASRCELSVNGRTNQLTITLRPIAAGKRKSQEGIKQEEPEQAAALKILPTGKSQDRGRIHETAGPSEVAGDLFNALQDAVVAPQAELEAACVSGSIEDGSSNQVVAEEVVADRADRDRGQDEFEPKPDEEASVEYADDETSLILDQPSGDTDAGVVLVENDTEHEPGPQIEDSQSDERDSKDADVLNWICGQQSSPKKNPKPESCANPEPEPEPQGAASEGAGDVSGSKSSSTSPYETASSVSGRPSRSAGYGQAASNGRPNIFNELLNKQHDEDFCPSTDEGHLPTDAPAGSQERIDAMRRRLEKGYDLWHEDDRVDFNGLTGAIRPVDDTD